MSEYRKLKLGLIGGGPGSFIGPVHRMAALMNDQYELTAGVFSSKEEKSIEFACTLGIPEERAYPNWQCMIEEEMNREHGVDVIAIMTPNDTHYPIIKALLGTGIHIICDKPITVTADEAEALQEAYDPNNQLLCVTYNYSAYPMVRQAREMVKNGELGAIRQVNSEYIQPGMAHLTQAEKDVSEWRLDPAKGGHSMVLSDIGTHSYHLLHYVANMDVTDVFADMGPSVPGRTVHDTAMCLLRFENGARGSMWITNAAAGAEHGLNFRIFGEKGGLEWHQEKPNELIFKPFDGFKQVLTRRKESLYPFAIQSTRLEIGHPEGYQEAFGNLYSDVANTILQGNFPNNGFTTGDLPGLSDGVKGVKFVDQAIQSNDSQRWMSL